MTDENMSQESQDLQPFPFEINAQEHAALSNLLAALAEVTEGLFAVLTVAARRGEDNQ